MFALATHRTAICRSLAVAIAVFSAGNFERVEAAEPTAESTDASREQVVSKAIGYLTAKGQAADGSYSSFAGPGVTALVTTGLLRNGRTTQDPLVAKSLKYLEGFVQPDGGIYKPGSNYKSYETCLAIMCLAEASQDGHFRDIIQKGDKFVKGLQWREENDTKQSDVNYGGAGYGESKRPDLSNTSFLMDALKAAGNGPDDEAVKRALVFVSRCQNLESEFNTTEFSAKNPDGGFYYTPAAGGTSQAGKTEQGGLRSYASMTYTGLKSMIFAGVGPEDPRVKAAVTWLRGNYSLKDNPGMGDNGLFYYYHTFAKTLDALGQEKFADAAGKEHSWREELAAELVSRQKEDGSFANANPRWMEGDPNLVTGYVLLTMQYLKPGK